MAASTYVFNNFRLELRQRALYRDDLIVRLTTKEFDALLILVQHHGHPVDKDLLSKALWGCETAREQSALPRHISALRRKLGDSTDEPVYIKTLSRSGYCFTAPVTTLSEADPVPVNSVPGADAHETESRGRSWRASPLLLAGISSGVLILFFSFYLYEQGSHQKHGSHQERPAVAVLSFQNQTNLPEANWLSNAVPEMLRTELSATEGIRLISGEEVARMERELKLPATSTYSAETVSRIRRNIAADFLVSGAYSVLSSTRNYRIDMEIENTSTNTVVASESVNGSEDSLFDMIARCGGSLRSRLGLSSLSSDEVAGSREVLPASLEATRLFTIGVSELRSSNPIKALDLLQKAAAADKGSALIRSALGEAWNSLGYEGKARENACRALSIGKVTTRENQLLLDGRCRELSHEWPRAIEVYQSLWTFFPDNLEHGLRAVHAEAAGGRIQDATKTLAEIEKRPDMAGNPRTDLSEAELAESQGDYEREHNAAVRALNKGRDRGNLLLVAKAQLRDCWALDNLGDRKQALLLAKSAEKTFSELGDKGGEATATKNVADVMDDGGDHLGAIPIYNSALQKFRFIGSQTGVIVTLNNMGVAMKDAGDLDGAAAQFSESVRLAREVGSAAHEAEALNSLAAVYWRRGNLQAAERMYDEAEHKFEEIGHRGHAATALGNLAGVLKDEGRFDEAQRRFQQSFDLSRSTGNESAMARTCGNEGDLLLKLARLSDARQKYQQQLEIANRIDDDKQRSYGFFGLGNVLLREGELARARESLRRSLELRTKHHERGLVAESRLALAEVELLANDQAGITDAKEAGEYFRQVGEVDREASAATLLLKSCLVGNFKIKANCDGYTTRLRQVLPQIEDSGSRARAYLALAAHCLAIQNREQALKLLNEAGQSVKATGDFEAQLEVALMSAEMNPDGEARKVSLEDVQRSAAGRGLLQIAREAVSIKGRERATRQ